MEINSQLPGRLRSGQAYGLVPINNRQLVLGGVPRFAVSISRQFKLPLLYIPGLLAKQAPFFPFRETGAYSEL